jgi:predicted nucleotidyltransferase
VLVHDDTVAAQAKQPVAQLLEDIVASHRAQLKQNLVGIYLHGSRATGDHGPNSDIDYLAVVKRSLNVEDKRKLVDELRGLSTRAPAHGIEMSVVKRETLRRFRHPAPFEFHFSGDWLGRYERGEVDLREPRRDPDLASHVVQARERGRVLFGEASERVFPPIDRTHYVEATLNDAGWIIKNPGDHPLYTVLNLSRALAVVKGGMIPSKLEAARWALETLPEELHPLVREARRRYQAGADGVGLDERDLAFFVSYAEDALGLHDQRH